MNSERNWRGQHNTGGPPEGRPVKSAKYHIARKQAVDEKALKSGRKIF